MADYGFVHLSAGQLLRDEAASGSEHGEMINKMIAEGAIVPVVVTCKLLKKAMHDQGWGAKTFLIDGFPRNQENYDGWMEVMGDQIHFGGVLHYKVDDEEALIQRIMERGKTSGRTDDNVDTVRRRLDQYKDQ